MDTGGRHFPKDVIVTAVRWYVAYPLSYRHVEELLCERGIEVDHTTVHRWVIRFSPLLLAQARRRQQKLGKSWRMDETYVCVRGRWCYLYRAVDRAGKTIDFFLSPHRDEESARRFLTRAMMLHGIPYRISIDGYVGNRAAIETINAERAKIHLRAIPIRQCAYLNNVLEQDHRGIKRKLKLMMGFKSFVSATATLCGIELAHFLRKGQLREKYSRLSLAQQFAILAA